MTSLTSPKRLLGALLAAVLATGCATPVYEGWLPWSDGWRAGAIYRLEISPKDLAFHRNRCNADVREPAPGQFAIVQWRNVGRSRWTMAPVPRGESLAPGDPVYVNASDCSAELVRRGRP